MESLPEMIDHRPFSRPRKLALVGLELLGEGVVDRFALLGRRTFFAGLAVLGGLTDDSCDLPVQSLHLSLLLGNVLLVLSLVFLKLVDKHPGIILLRLQLAHLRHPLRADGFGLFPHRRENLALPFKRGLHLLDLGGLNVHLLGKIPEVAVPPERLTHVVTREDVHVPDLGTPVHVGAPHKLGVVVRKSVHTRCQSLYLLLLHGDGVGIFRNHPVAFLDQLLSGVDLAADQCEPAQGVGALGRVAQDLLVENGDLLLKPRPAGLL